MPTAHVRRLMRADKPGLSESEVRVLIRRLRKSHPERQQIRDAARAEAARLPEGVEVARLRGWIARSLSR